MQVPIVAQPFRGGLGCAMVEMQFVHADMPEMNSGSLDLHASAIFKATSKGPRSGRHRPTAVTTATSAVPALDRFVFFTCARHLRAAEETSWLAMPTSSVSVPNQRGLISAVGKVGVTIAFLKCILLTRTCSE
jgi:hypothetical protein